MSDVRDAPVGAPAAALMLFDPSLAPAGAYRPLRRDDLRDDRSPVVIGGTLVGGGDLSPADGRDWTAFYLFNASGTDDAVFTVITPLGAFDVTLAAGGEYDEKGQHRSVVVASSGPVVWRGSR